MAYLDKIIEECDEDLEHNNYLKELEPKYESFIRRQQEKIKHDGLKIEIENDHRSKGDFIHELAFDKSFYGKAAVERLISDQY